MKKDKDDNRFLKKSLYSSDPESMKGLPFSFFKDAWQIVSEFKAQSSEWKLLRK